MKSFLSWISSCLSAVTDFYYFAVAQACSRFQSAKIDATATLKGILNNENLSSNKQIRDASARINSNSGSVYQSREMALETNERVANEISSVAKKISIKSNTYII